MARPRTIDDAAVLDAAVRAVGRVGPAGLTLAAVASEAGLAPATVVQRFGSKRGLLLAVAARGASVGGLAAPVPDGRSVLDAAVEALVARVAGIDSPGTLANHLAFLQMDLADPEFHALALADAERLRAALHTAVESALARGELWPCSVAVIARALQVTYNGALVTWAIEPDGELAGSLRRALEVVLAPYRRPAPTSGSA